MKTCSKCKVIKDLSQFYKDRSSRDGLTAYCRDCDRERSKKWRTDNLEREKERSKKWRTDNLEREKERNKKWKAANPNLANAKSAKRRATKRSATPPWYLQVKSQVLAIYQEAGRLGYAVDHIIPLTHPLVCGLHVPANLRPLDPSTNSAKGNKFQPIVESDLSVPFEDHWLRPDRYRNPLPLIRYGCPLLRHLDQTGYL